VPREHLAHLGDRLDGDHPQSPIGEESRQLPRAGREVDDGVARLERRGGDDRVDRLGRVGRAGTLVRVRGPSERLRTRMNAQYAPFCAATAGSVFSRIVTSSQIDQFSR
jgi:hypothetical protein